ncbi:hypothetical protein KAS41_04030 [Candidatus Parcubacteria bacterium]|nr:hypothetical protein [Candidatus Parcubacteria bacterium]
MLKRILTIFILSLFAMPIFAAPLQMIAPDYYHEGDTPFDRIELCDELEFKTEEYGINPLSGYRCIKGVRNVNYILESNNSQSVYLKTPEAHISSSRQNGIFFIPGIVPKNSVLKIQVESFQENRDGIAEIIIYGKSQKYGYLYDRELTRQNISKSGEISIDLDFYFSQGIKDTLILAGSGASARIQSVVLDSEDAPITADEDNKKFIFFTVILFAVIISIIVIICFLILSKI